MEPNSLGNALKACWIVDSVRAKELPQPALRLRKLLARSVNWPRRQHRMQVKLRFDTDPFQLKLMSLAYGWNHAIREALDSPVLRPLSFRARGVSLCFLFSVAEGFTGPKLGRKPDPGRDFLARKRG